MALMLRSLASSFSSERSQLPCIDPLPLSRAPSRTDGGKVKRTPEPVRASPYPPLKRSSPGFGSGSRRQSMGPPLKRTTSLHGGDSLASLQRAASEARQQSFCKPTNNKHRRQTNGPLRPALSLANTLVLDPLVCPPPVPISRNSIVHAPVPVPPAPKPPTPTIFSHSQVRRRSSLAPEPSAPTALVTRTNQVPLPSPPCVIGSKKKRESLAQRTLRRQFERTPRGAQVKVHGAHAALRMMSEAEEEAAVAAVVVVEDGSDSEDVCMADSWVEVAPEEMEWSIIEGNES